MFIILLEGLWWVPFWRWSITGYEWEEKNLTFAKLNNLSWMYFNHLFLLNVISDESSTYLNELNELRSFYLLHKIYYYILLCKRWEPSGYETLLHIETEEAPTDCLWCRRDAFFWKYRSSFFKSGFMTTHKMHTPKHCCKIFGDAFAYCHQSWGGSSNLKYADVIILYDVKCIATNSLTQPSGSLSKCNLQYVGHSTEVGQIQGILWTLYPIWDKLLPYSFCTESARHI